MSSVRKRPNLIDIFTKLGIILNNQEETFNILNVDQRKFQTDLRDFLKNQSTQVIDDIKKQIESYLDDEKNFLVALLPTKINTELVQSHSSNQDNLMKLLVEIEQLQCDLFEYLIAKITAYCQDSVDADIEFMNININIPIYIINQFRYQPKILNPEEICRKLLDVVKTIKLIDVKREIIECLPDILCDSNHDNIVSELEELLEDSNLLSSTLDTLSNLKFTDTNTMKLVNKLFEIYDSSIESDLSALVKFLLKAASNLNSKDIINRLRNCIDFDKIKNEKNRFAIFAVIKDYFEISMQLVELYMNTITQSITDSTINLESTLIKSVDFMIFSIIYASSQHFKQADKIFKQIIKEDDYLKHAEKVVESVFKLGPSIIRELFNSIFIVAKSLIFSAYENLSAVGEMIYKLGFDLVERKLKQKIISMLVEYITNSNGAPRDNSLDVLVDLSSVRISLPNSSGFINQLVTYSPKLKSLLDFIEYFNIGQIRKVYFVICSIAYSSHSANKEQLNEISIDSSSFNLCTDIQDNVIILINKQLSSSLLKSKQMGVIGALMMITNMSNASKKLINASNEQSLGSPQHDGLNQTSSDEYFSLSSSSSSISILNQDQPGNSTSICASTTMILNNISHDITNIWQIIIDSSKSSPESLGLFEDDLTHLLHKNALPPTVEALIKDNLKDMTVNLFKLENHDLNEEKLLQSFKFGYEFGLDSQAHGSLNLLNLVINDMRKKNFSLIAKEKVSKNMKNYIPTITLASTFRLMAALERKSILELKDYLGIPILSIKKDELYRFGSMVDSALKNNNGNNLNTIKFKSLPDEERKMICDLLFYLVNWFIELINTFCVCIKSNSYDENKNVISQEENDLNLKLISRLSTIYDLQQVLVHILPHMKYYRAPMAVFGLIDSSVDELPFVHTLIKPKDSGVKKKDLGKKRGKKQVDKKVSKKKKLNEDDEAENDEIEEDPYEDEKELVDDSESDEDDFESFNKENVASNLADFETDLNKISIYFREFDLNVINFVNLKLELNPNEMVIPDSSDRMNNPNKNLIITRIKPHLFSTILSDINKKLAVLLKASNSSAAMPFRAAFVQSKAPTKISIFMQLNNTTAKDFIENLVENCFDNICNHLDSIYKFIREIQNKYDGLKDPSELIKNQKNIYIIKCLNQLLKLLNILFSWLESNNQPKLIDEVIKKIAAKLEVSSRSANAATQIDKVPELFCFKYLCIIKDVILDLNTADLLIKILDLLCNKIVFKRGKLPEAYEKKFRQLLIDTCKEFLLNDYNPLLSSICSSKQINSEAITNMLNVLIRNDDDNSLDLVGKLCNIITGDDFIENRDNCDIFNTLRLYFISYYKVLIEHSVTSLKFVDKYDFKSLNIRQGLLKEIVKKISTIVSIHCRLVELKKNRSFKEINILTVLKHSRLFLNSFLRTVMPWLDQAFEDFKQEVVSILQQLQQTIHYLQEVCILSEQTHIAKQTPVYMRCVETFFLRVKQLLYVNNSDDAFTMDLFQNKTKNNEKSQKKEKPAKRGKSKKDEEEDGSEKEAEEENSGEDDEVNSEEE